MRWLVVLLLLLLSVPVRAEDSQFLTNLFCPPVGNLSDGTCNPVCPKGYVLSGDVSAGVYVCIPKEVQNPGQSYQKCFYYDPDCVNESVKKVVDQTFGRTLSDFWNKKEPLINILIRISSFDPSASVYFKETKEFPEFNLITGIVSDLSGAFVTAFWKLLEVIIWGIVAVISAWYLPKALPLFSTKYTDSLSSYIESKYADLRAPLVGVVRVLFAFALVFTPIPTGNGEFVSAIQKVVEKSALVGSDIANDLSHKITKRFFIFAAENFRSLAKSDDAILKTSLDYQLRSLRLDTEKVKDCIRAYGKVDLTLIPDRQLWQVPAQDQLFAAANGLTRRKCKEIEINYKKDLEDYAVLYRRYNGNRDFLKWLESENLAVDIAQKADELSKEDAFTLKVFKDKKKAALISMAIVAKMTRDYGWFMVPVAVFPAVSVVSAVSDANKSIAEAFTKEDMSPGLFAKMMAVVSFPPGSWIFTTLTRISLPIAEAAGKTVAAVFDIPLIGKITKLALVGKAAELGAVTTAVLGILIFTYLVTGILFKVLPILFLGIVITIRVFFWLIDISKMIIISPLIILTAFASHHAHRFWGFVTNILILSLYPLAILASALLAYFASMILADLSFYFPLKIIFDYLGNVGFFDVLQVGDVSAGGSIFGTVATATVYYLSFILKIVVIWTVGMNGPDKIFQLLRLNEYVPSSGEVRELAEQLKKPASPV